MKILFLTENYFPNRGGMAQSCDRIVEHLRRKGVVMDVFHFSNRKNAFTWNNVSNGRYVAAQKDENASHSINMAWNVMKRSLQEAKYDAIAAFGGQLPLLSGTIWSQWLGLPLVVLFRGNDLDMALFDPKKIALVENAVKQATVVCAVSSDKKWKLDQLFPGKDIRFIANGIDMENWELLPSDAEQAEGLRSQTQPATLNIGFFGHLKSKKGFHFFLDAIQNSKAPEKIHLLITGEMTDKDKELLESGSVAYTSFGFRDRDELPAIYSACDVVAIPSYYDGMPNVLLESLGLGIPVVASRVDGMADVLEDSGAGWLFEPGDRRGCIDLINELLGSDKESLVQKGARGKALVMGKYSAASETDAYLEVFGSVIFPEIHFENKNYNENQ